VRVLDFGVTTAARSQSCWHALARCAHDGDSPTLSFVRPDSAYACLGFHRHLDELDVGWCREQGLPVLRRMIGGGPVYLDSDQWFFQITLPARAVTGRRDRVLANLLQPAVAALRALGVNAELDDYGEITVRGAKVCGHGAGQLRDGVVVVGNLITAFDHDRAARILNLDEAARTRVLDLMHRHVAATAVDAADWQAAMVQSYARHFGSPERPAEPRADELAEAERLDAVLSEAAFVAGADQVGKRARQVKIRGGVYVEVAA
jgi:lipoate-protein ligase A